MKRALSILAITMLMVTACGSEAGDAGEEGVLIIYSGRSEELVQPLIDMFS